MTFRRAAESDMAQILRLITDIFAGEQGIPEELIPIPAEAGPVWWCIEDEGAVAGCVALYREEDGWHMGRFAVAESLRGRHLGSELIRFAVRDAFAMGIEEIRGEARDTTVHITRQLGAAVTGAPEPFYEGNVTPMLLRREDFLRPGKTQSLPDP